MPYFSKKSKLKLEHCHPYLQLILNKAIQFYDFSIICSYRNKFEQFDLFKKGRKLENGIWVIEDKNKIVTYNDGIKKKSLHNKLPALAVDIVPYPTLYSSEKEFYQLAGFVKLTAKFLGVELVWGGDWRKIKDFPHFELG